MTAASSPKENVTKQRGLQCASKSVLGWFFGLQTCGNNAKEAKWYRGETTIYVVSSRLESCSIATSISVHSALALNLGRARVNEIVWHFISSNLVDR